MTIAEAREKCKSVLAKTPRDLLIILVLLLASSASFGLGYLSGIDAGQRAGISQEDSPIVAASTSGQIVAAKGGTKYYLPGCAGADRISEANKVWFVSATAAAKAGYTPAVNCKGL